MKKLSKRKSKKMFGSTANITRAANITPRVKRGGIRA